MIRSTRVRGALVTVAGLATLVSAGCVVLAAEKVDVRIVSSRPDIVVCENAAQRATRPPGSELEHAAEPRTALSEKRFDELDL
jgi:hypothetical protein